MDRFTSPVWELELKKPASWPKLHETELARPVRTWMKLEMQPSVSIEYRGAPTTTNRWGMRDQDYALEKPPGTWRAVLIGSSHLMGSGVRDDETFEALIEKKLNEARPGGYARYELLNFGVESYTAPQQLDDLRTRALRFAPDAAIYVAHSIDRTKARNHVAGAQERGIEIPHAYLREILAKAGAQPGEGEPAIKQKLVPFAESILRWSYAEFVRSAREAGAVPIWLLIPTPQNDTAEEIVASTTQLARDAGFVVIDEVQTAYAHLPWEEVAVAEWDDHPNAKGHALIADRTLEALVAREAEIWRTSSSRVAEENPEAGTLENAQ